MDAHETDSKLMFRNASELDLAAVAKLMKATQDAHVEAYPQRYNPMSEQAIEDLLRADLSSAARFVVAYEDDTVLGYTLLDFLAAPESPVLKPRRYGYLRQIGVAPEARGRGIGSALIQDLRQACQGEGIVDIELDVWAFNAGARKFFEDAGFELFATKMRISA